MTDDWTLNRITKGHRASVVVVLLLMVETPAAAYTDPGSGALLWQILVAGFVGAMFYWRKLTRWFRSKTRG